MDILNDAENTSIVTQCVTIVTLVASLLYNMTNNSVFS